MSIKAIPCVALLCHATAFLPVRAQSTIQLGDRPSCSACRPSLQPVVRLGASNDPGGFAPLVQIAINARNEYVVSSSTFVGELFVYGSDGMFQRSVGRRGDGPGEFSHPQFVTFDSTDSLHTVDMGGARYSVFAPDLTFARAAQLQARTLAFELDATGNLFIVGPKPAGSVTHALQMVAPDGSALQSFDPVDPSARGQAAFGRNIAVDAGNHRWSIANAKYELNEWDPDSRLIRQVQARRDWIPDSLPMRLDLSREKPPGQIGGLELDEQGMIWVFAIVPDANWRPVEPSGQPDMTRLYDTLIEVIDPVTNTLLARGRHDSVVLPIRPGRAYSMIEAPDGDRRIQIWRMEITGR